MPIIVKDLPKRKRRVGQWIANISVCISYSTGEPLFYSVRTKLDDYVSHRFLSLEEAMVWCDMHNLYINTNGWDKTGLMQVYALEQMMPLENGSMLTLPDGY